MTSFAARNSSTSSVTAPNSPTLRRSSMFGGISPIVLTPGLSVGLRPTADTGLVGFERLVEDDPGPPRPGGVFDQRHVPAVGLVEGERAVVTDGGDGLQPPAAHTAA